MGMFYSKLMKESATVDVEDVIQTPDDIGVDLDAIEKAIAGEDGIEAHRDEIEAAEKGVVGDSLEEATIIMYESEYNYNQIMRCIGIAELAEFSEGRDFVLEGANLKAFFEKVRTMFTKMFEGLTKLFTQAVAKLSDKLSFDKALVNKHGDEIKAGYANGEWAFEKAYNFNKLNVEYKPDSSKIWDAAIDAIKDASEGLKSSEEPISHIECVKRVSGLTVSDESTAAGEMVAKLKERDFVECKYAHVDGNNMLLDTVMEILKSDNDIKALRATYKAIKDDYKKLFAWLKECEKTFENVAVKPTVMTWITVAKYEKNLQHSYFAHCLRAHNTKRAQARRMALTWQRAAKTKEDKPIVQHNSAMFNLSFI